MVILILMLGAWPPMMVQEPMPAAYCEMAGKQWVAKHGNALPAAQADFICLRVGE